MMKYLFSTTNAKVDLNYGDGNQKEYISPYHEYIVKSIRGNSENGELDENLYKEILGTVLWMPVATKWTSDFMQTIMLHAVLSLVKKSNLGYYNNFLPVTFDITCGSGGIKEGGMMYEMITGNGVLHATDYDPIKHKERQNKLPPQINDFMLDLKTFVF